MAPASASCQGHGQGATLTSCIYIHTYSNALFTLIHTSRTVIVPTACCMYPYSLLDPSKTQTNINSLASHRDINIHPCEPVVTIDFMFLQPVFVQLSILPNASNIGRGPVEPRYERNVVYRLEPPSPLLQLVLNFCLMMLYRKSQHPQAAECILRVLEAE